MIHDEKINISYCVVVPSDLGNMFFRQEQPCVEYTHYGSVIFLFLVHPCQLLETQAPTLDSKHQNNSKADSAY